MKTRILFFLFVLGLFLFSCNSNKNSSSDKNTADTPKAQSVCDDNTARIIGKLYYISNPIFVFDNWTMLDEFVKNNRNILLPGSPVIECMKQSGNNMIRINMQSFDPQSGNKAYESVIGMGGSMDDANAIKSNIESNQIELYSLGLELIWLSEVLPKGAQGDWSDFFNTGTQTRRAALEAISIMLPQLRVLDGGYALNYLINYFKQYQPYLEYQTALMVSWSNQ